MFSIILLLIAGVLLITGTQKGCFLISFNNSPYFPIAKPGFSASLTTQDPGESNIIFLILAFSPIIFLTTFSAFSISIVIEAEKPGLAIGKYGELLKEIKKQTFWVPVIRRTPAIRSKIIENIRQVLYENNDYRK